MNQRGFSLEGVGLGVTGVLGGGLMLAQIAPTQVPDLVAIVTSTGVPGLLVYFLVASMRRETTATEKYAERLELLTKQLADQSERLLSTVIGLIPPPEKGRK